MGLEIRPTHFVKIPTNLKTVGVLHLAHTPSLGTPLVTGVIDSFTSATLFYSSVTTAACFSDFRVFVKSFETNEANQLYSCSYFNGSFKNSENIFMIKKLHFSY